MYLFQEFFYEKNPRRLEEYIFCIQQNVKLSFVKKIFLLIDANEYAREKSIIDNIIKYINSDKVILIEHSDCFFNERITFNTILFDIIPDFVDNNIIEEDAIVGLMNLDIFLAESDEWKYVNDDFFKITNSNACLALSRMEYVRDDFIFKNKEAWATGEFCDAWFMKLPLKIVDDDFRINNQPYSTKIPLGNSPGCDNAMFEILSKKYKVFNWAEKYIIYHYDVARKPSVKNGEPAPMIINEKCIKLNLNTNYTLSPNRDWDKYLEKFRNKNVEIELDEALEHIKNNWYLIPSDLEKYIIEISKRIKKV
jgi:hypothetical protein